MRRLVKERKMDRLNWLSESWFELFFPITLQGSLFALLVLAVSWLAAKRNTSPALHIFLLVFALIKLFVPPIQLSPVLTDAFGGVELPEVIAGGQLESGYESWIVVLFTLWIIGVATLLIRVISRHFKLLQKLSRAGIIPATPDIPANVQLLRSAEEHSPLVTGFFKHTILLPASSRRWKPGVQRTIIAHELQHVRSGDHWINLLQILSQVLFFFNPVVWLLNNRINLYREIHCDNKTINALAIKPRSYAANLLHIAESISNTKKILPAASYFSQCRSGLSKRIMYQLQKEGNPLKANILSGAAIAMLVMLMAIPFSCSSDTATATGIESDIVEMSKLTTKPKLTSTPELKYPPLAKKADIEGTVVVAVLVDKAGNVVEASIEKSVPDLDQAALDFVQASSFSAGEVDGKAVSTKLKLPIKFVME